MKTVIFLVTILLAIKDIRAQECKGFYYLNNGQVEMTIYDKKSEENGKVTYTITGATTSGSATTAAFSSEMVNEKGKSLSKGSGTYKCNGGIMYVDAKVAVPQEELSPYKNMDVKADEIYIEYPAALSDGQTLKEVNFKMEVFNKGNLFTTITFDEINRKVEGKETFTTHAGSWECWKISYEVKFKAAVPPMNMGIPITMQCTEWFAPGFGVVKTETYNRNGKLMGWTQITSVKK